MTRQDTIRIRLFADTHLGFDYSVKPRIERRRRGPDFFDNFRRVLDGAIESNVDVVVHGGDLFFRSRVPPKIVDLVYEDLFRFADKGIPIVIVPGNHERSRLPASLYLSHPNIYVFAEPATYTLEVRGREVCLSGFPFERRNIRGRFKQVLNATGWKQAMGDVNVLCMHQSVEGAQVGPRNYTFRNGDDVIRFADLPIGFNAILAGHIHRRQILERNMGNGKRTARVIYPGSTERTSFAEKGETKGFFDLAFVKLDSGGWRMRSPDFRLLPSRPMVDVCLDEKVSGHNLERFLRSKAARINKDAIVRIKWNGPVDDATRKLLTSQLLRTIFPPSMNVQISANYLRTTPTYQKR